MTRLEASKAREDFADTLNRVAYGHERIVLRRRGKDVAALVPLEDLAFLEQLEDRVDLEEAKRILADPNEAPIPYRRVRKELKLKR
jgi:prevent-host-death family protein